MIRLAVRCRPEAAERVLAELVALVPGGVEEEAGDGYVEYAIYGAPGELPALPDVKAAADAGLVQIATTELPDDWADRWRDFHEPALVADRIWVRPSWAEPRPVSDPAEADAGADEESPSRRRGQGVRAGAGHSAGIDVVVDPGQAFGTGGHATTRLCLELLVELADAGAASGPLADWGTGSGVLAIAAAKLGFDPVLGCDHERAALEAAAENARLNGVRLELAKTNLRTDPAPIAPTVVANLTAPILREIATRLEAAPNVLVCSGMLEREVDEVAEAFASVGLREETRRQEGEWAAARLARIPS